LKSCVRGNIILPFSVASHRGAWIEIEELVKMLGDETISRVPQGRVD